MSGEDKILTVGFDETSIGALGMLLDLVHYDDLALLMRDMLPPELLAALSAQRSAEGAHINEEQT